MKKIKLHYFFTFVTLMSSYSAVGALNTYSFNTIWKMVLDHEPEIKATAHELESAQFYENRMSRHWYPRVFVSGRAFTTNDPTVTFFSLLGQRQVVTSDFSPQTLNYPGNNLFEYASIGMDLPLYEGGSKTAMVKASKKITEAKTSELEAVKVERYSNLAQAYASILSFQNERKELQELKQEIDKILSNYKIGTKSNPVGYSGLLGLKNIQNRMRGLSLEHSARTEALRDQIRVSASDLPENWNPEPESIQTFIQNSFRKSSSSRLSTSSSVRALQLVAESVEKGNEAEKARFLPKVGLFTTGDLYNGSRGSGTSYSAGAYVQWNLFSATDYGVIGQANATAAAAQARADSLSEKNRIAVLNSEKLVEAIIGNLSVMDESLKLLKEQTQVAQTLFHNGSINALQLVEVIARRMDLVVNRTEAELNLAQAYATQFKSSAEGVLNENPSK